MSTVLVPMIRTFAAAEFDPVELAAAKGDQRISVCLPARNEEATVGAVVRAVREHLMERVALVDELVVIDDHSTDRTARVARDAGAQVVPADQVLARYGTGHGKGEALWKSLFVSDGDLVVWCDADVHDFDPAFVVGLAGPLLTRPEIGFVKGFYERPLRAGQDGGGRVTELVARPALALLFPHLASVAQPLAGEYAGRRDVLEQLPFVGGYGVDIALLIDVAEQFGLDTLAQVDLGRRVHRNRTLAELAPQATSVLHAVLARATPGAVGDAATLLRPDELPMEVEATELPALVTVPEYGRPGLRRTGSSDLGA
jgi:glucosyl-3-phosphoglycerate synthase